MIKLAVDGQEGYALVLGLPRQTFVSGASMVLGDERHGPVKHASIWKARRERARCRDVGLLVGAGHELGEVIRGEERPGHRRSPAVEGPDVVKDLRLPELVVDDAVEIGVVLGEVARGVLEIPEEVSADFHAAGSAQGQAYS